MKKIATLAVAGGLVMASLSGCSWTPKTEKGALIGAGTGAVVGGLATRSVGGAAVGAGVGALAGYAISKNSYRCQKRNIFGQLYWGWCIKP
jgi:hypothetical protein